MCHLYFTSVVQQWQQFSLVPVTNAESETGRELPPLNRKWFQNLTAIAVRATLLLERSVKIEMP